MVFHQFHYPFSLRIPPRWKLIHGCLRCATVRLLTNSDHGFVPQGWRAWSRHRESEEARGRREAPRREMERIAMHAPRRAPAARERKTTIPAKAKVETKPITPHPAAVAETTSAKTAVPKEEGKKTEEPAPEPKTTKPEAKADTEHRTLATASTEPKAPAQAAKIPDATLPVAKATVPPPPAPKQTPASH